MLIHNTSSPSNSRLEGRTERASHAFNNRSAYSSSSQLLTKSPGSQMLSTINVRSHNQGERVAFSNKVFDRSCAGIQFSQKKRRKSPAPSPEKTDSVKSCPPLYAVLAIPRRNTRKCVRSGVSVHARKVSLTMLTPHALLCVRYLSIK